MTARSSLRYAEFCHRLYPYGCIVRYDSHSFWSTVKTHKIAAMATFKYTPLNRQTRSIRLLRFELESPTTACPRPSCLMETFDLDQCPPFVALSYTWGPPDLSREISVDGKAFHIRENLYLAMSELQMTGMPAARVSHDPLREHELIRRHFWIDAICINQEDILERGHQVNLMESIFTGATCVIAWLGTEADGSKLVIHTIRSQFRNYAARSTRDHDHKAHPKYQLLRSAFRCLTSRSYWNRMWIVQEFMLPKKLLLLCGEHSAWWDDLLASKPMIMDMMLLQSGWLELWEARERWQRFNIYHGDIGDAVARGLLGAQAADQSPTSDMRLVFTREHTLDELLFAFIYGQCSDARDRVYALLSLVRHRRPHSFRSLLPDYTISAEQLYYRVLSHLRYSPSLAEDRSWSNFRDVIRTALKLDPNKVFLHLHDTLYEITGSISWQRMAASFGSYEQLQCRFSLWRQSLGEQGGLKSFQRLQYLLWQQSLKAYGLLDSDTPFSSYRELINLFRTFPRHLDPQAWRDFESLAKVALGIPQAPLPDMALTSSTSELIDQHARANQAKYRDKATWDAFLVSHKAIYRQDTQAHESFNKHDIDQLLEKWMADNRAAISPHREPRAQEETSEPLALETEQTLGIGDSTLEQFHFDNPKTQFCWRFRPATGGFMHDQDAENIKHGKASLSSW